MLGERDTTIRTWDGSYSLRPSLRAALLAERHCNGLQRLARDISEFRTEAVAKFIAIASTEPVDEADVLADIAQSGTLARHGEITSALLKFTASLYGMDEPEKDAGKPKTGKASAENRSLEEGFRELFSIGTGWLGWTPEETWNASPSEIIAAYDGRVAMLKVLFGSGNSEPPPLSREQHNAKIKSLFPNAKVAPRKRRKTNA